MEMASDRWPWRRRTLPPRLSAALDPEEHVQVLAGCLDGKMLAASRFGLWVIEDEKASRLGWELVAKARLSARVLSIVPTQVVDEAMAWLKAHGADEWLLHEARSAARPIRDAFWGGDALGFVGESHPDAVAVTCVHLPGIAIPKPKG